MEEQGILARKKIKEVICNSKKRGDIVGQEQILCIKKVDPCPYRDEIYSHMDGNSP